MVLSLSWQSTLDTGLFSAGKRVLWLNRLNNERAAYKWHKSRYLSLSALFSNKSPVASRICVIGRTRTRIKICPFLFHQMPLRLSIFFYTQECIVRRNSTLGLITS